MTEEYLKDVKIVFVSDFYDVPLSGHAWYKGKYCFFELVNPEKEDLYRLYSVSRLETILRIVERKMFEDIVGYSWTSLTTTRSGEGIKPDFVESYRHYWDDPDLQYMMAKDRSQDVNHTKKLEIGLFILD